MNQTEQQYEMARLDFVLRKIQLKIEKSMENSLVSVGNLQEALSEYWECPGMDFRDQAQLMEAIGRQRSLAEFSNKRQLQFIKMASSPYFGRIDFIEDGSTKPEMIYIGIANLVNSDSGEIWIYDWRSPVAGMFYDYEKGYSQYQCPAGTIHGQIVLKRQYKIEDGKMKYMFDADLKIDDEMLQELLGRSVDDKMRTIVNTIQREQNRVIRDELHRILLVQGPAGSGKTSIALHRAAYLLYWDRKRTTAENILIFSPNRIFSDYISNVLPELGEENILQTTFLDYIDNIGLKLPLETEGVATQLEYLLDYSGESEPEQIIRAAGVSYKSSPEFVALIQKYLSYLTEQGIKEYPAIEYLDHPIFSKAEWEELFFKNLAYLPVMERLSQIKKRIRIKLRPLIHEMRRKKEQEIAASGEEVNEKTIKALARLETWRELRNLVLEIDAFTTIKPLLLYRRLFEEDGTINNLTKGSQRPQYWQSICRQTLAGFDNGKMLYEDYVPFLYFLCSLSGFPAKKDIHHVILDEAQDYTELQFEILGKFFPDCTWTILGDPDQAINPCQHAARFQRIAGILNPDSHPGSSLIVQLKKGYRSTQEIQAFSKAILSQAPGEHIRRSGTLPQATRVNAADMIPEYIAGVVRTLKEEGWRSIAIITKTVKESYLAYGALKNRTALTLVTQEMANLQQGTVIIPAYLAKGLEFDAVIIYDAGSKTYRYEGERHSLYISCTRALHRLLLFYSEELSPFIKGIDGALFQNVVVG